MPLIYMLEFSNGKKYIGQTKQTIEQRFKHYIGHAKWANGKTLCTQACYTVGLPKITVILECSAEELNLQEVLHIQKYGTQAPHGYNVQKGGGRTLKPTTTLKEYASVRAAAVKARHEAAKLKQKEKRQEATFKKPVRSTEVERQMEATAKYLAQKYRVTT